jgi:biopolymer transport protein ExbD/biopolymer transport protein TolR
MGIASAARKASHNVNASINVTPMCDVMLVLLIIFMVITPMLNNKVQIDMVKVNNSIPMPDANKDDSIVVAITRNGAVFMGQNEIDPSQLTGMVETKLQDQTDKTVYIRADARAEYKAVEDAVDDVRSAGVDDVGLLVQRREGNLAGGD